MRHIDLGHVDAAFEWRQVYAGIDLIYLKTRLGPTYQDYPMFLQASIVILK